MIDMGQGMSIPTCGPPTPSRDLAFRDVFHGNIAEYLKAVTPEEFDKFIGSKSLDFDAIMALPENQEVLKILKQAEDE